MTPAGRCPNQAQRIEHRRLETRVLAMRLPRSRALNWGVVVIALFVCGIGKREDRYSCHLCRGLKERRITTLVSMPVWQGETPVRFRTIETPHRHDWWRYSYSYSNGLGGCLGSGVACHTDGRYKDEQTGVAVARGSPRTK
jgi:hypothetical protein